MSIERAKCPTCGRVVWDGSGVLEIDECWEQGSDVCRLFHDRNSLIAAVKLLAKQKCDKPTVRTVLAIVEKIVPSPHHCPLCNQPGVVRKGTVVIHFATVQSSRPCEASTRTVLGGVLIE